MVIISLGGWWYLRQHKTEVLQRLKAESGKYLNGELNVGDVGFSFFHTFPKLSITVKDIRLQDSLWNLHHHDLLYAREAFASLDFFKLFTGRVEIDRIILEEARIYLYTDSAGYKNTSVFRKQPSPDSAGRLSAVTPVSDSALAARHAAAAGSEPVHYPVIDIRRAVFIVDRKDRNKYFSFDIPRLICRPSAGKDAGDIDMDLNLDTKVNRLAFNEEKGSFIEDREVKGRFKITLNTETKQLSFDGIRLRIDDQSFLASGRFFLAAVPTPFRVDLATADFSYKKAAGFVTPNIRKKLDLYAVQESMDSLVASIDGMDTNYHTPLLHVRVRVGERAVVTPLTTLERCSFTGEFDNQVDSGKGRDDRNSLMRFTHFKANWLGMPMESDSIVISNLTRPVISMSLHSGFALSNLNNLIDTKAFRFNQGRGKLDINYNGPLTDQKEVHKRMTGTFSMDDAVFTYQPRNFNMTQGKARFRFTGKDVLVDALRINTGTTTLNMTGSISNLFSLIDETRGQLLVDWNIRSEKLNLDDFRGFLKKRADGGGNEAVTQKKVLLSSSLTRVTDLLENASMRLKLKADELVYKKFLSNTLRADIQLDNDAMTLRNIGLQLASGSLTATADLRNEPAANPFSFQAQLNNVHVDQVLDAFDGFGQTALNNRNLKGNLNANVILFGEVTGDLHLIPDSSHGQIDFRLSDGELVDFEPLQKISHTVFKKRDFNNIRFAELQNRFLINGNNITINRMEIRSTVMSMFVEGLYNMKKGADLSIQVPLSNLKKGEVEIDPANLDPDRKTGISARLRAKTGDDGKLKVSWDPFRKGLKQIRKASAGNQPAPVSP